MGLRYSTTPTRFVLASGVLWQRNGIEKRSFKSWFTLIKIKFKLQRLQSLFYRFPELNFVAFPIHNVYKFAIIVRLNLV